MNGFDEREYNTVVLAALLHDDRSRFIGDVGKGDVIRKTRGSS